MLDRMIIDIARWIFIIAIFFIAFGCSLFFIFSFFSVVLQQQNALIQSSTSSINSSISIINQSSTAINNGNCPDYFYQLLNQTIPVIVDATEGDTTNNDNNQDAWERLPNYPTLKKVGHYPAIHYFGQSFGTTLLTIFFTLFNVIGELGVPVSIQNSKIESSSNLFLGSWL
jgi:hypothetical protein